MRTQDIHVAESGRSDMRCPISMLGWRHAFGDVTPTSIMAFAGGSPFTVAGVPIAANAALADLGFDINVTPNATLGVTYGGQFGSGVTDQTLRGNFAVRF